MRLLKVSSIGFVQYADERQTPSYGILSHRWQDVEITYQDIISGTARKSKAYHKIRNFCRECQNDGLSYAWVDTCCINKDSSAELSEAINSMYRWYQNATKCYVYLSDVQVTSRLADSSWFERGWTLQELIAPNEVHFYGNQWQHLGTKLQLCSEIEAITQIPQDVLHGEDPRNYSIAQRMSWSAKRTTTRVEDHAYSLLGLFNVNMPMLYGEGERAFIRLQEEIIKYSADQSIFAWPGIISEYHKSEMYEVTSRRLEGLFATAPSAFQFCGGIKWQQQQSDQQQSFSMTNLGVSMEILLRSISTEVYEGKLNCFTELGNVSIFLRQTDQDGQYLRQKFNGSLSKIWQHKRSIDAQNVRVNVVQGHQTDQDQSCRPIIAIGPGPVFDDEFHGRISIVTIPDKSLLAKGNKKNLTKPGLYTDLEQIEVEGSPEPGGIVTLDFGFDFFSNPYFGVTVYVSSVQDNQGIEVHDTVCTESIWHETLERNVLFQHTNGERHHRWIFKAHRSQGVLAVLADLNVILNVQKKQLLAHRYWTVDIQKVDPKKSLFMYRSVSPSIPKIVNLLSGHQINERFSQEDMCPICETLLIMPIRLGCKHQFCQSCYQWANISIVSTHLAHFEDRVDTVTGHPIICPICGKLTHAQLNLDHQRRIQQSRVPQWRFANWKSQNIEASEKFPLLETLTLTIGNTHKLTRLAYNNESGRSNRHDWTFYIRPSRPDLISNIKITLHKSFRDNVLVFTAPPFEVRRFGWGTFEIQAEVRLKSQYNFLHEHAIVQDELGRSGLDVSWKLDLSADDSQGWLKLIVGRSKPKTSLHDAQLLAQYGRLRLFQVLS